MKKSTLLAALALAFSSSAYAGPVIEQMHTATFGHYVQEYFAGNGKFMVFSNADKYSLSDGTQWEAGAGWHPDTYSSLKGTAVIGDKIRYTFNPLVNGTLFQNTDYSFGDHSSQGELTVDGPLMMTAALGGKTGFISGYTTIKSNNATWYGEPRFNYYGAKPGDKVYFEQNFALTTGNFTANLFNTNFRYNLTGVVDFTKKAPSQVPEPGSSLLLLGALAGAMLVRRRRQR